MKHVGENIKRIRTEKKMTISDLANEHVSRGMISLIENGKTQPSIERLHHIAVQLNVDIAELVEEISKEVLRRKINEAIELFNIDEVAAVITLLKPMLTKMDQSYEAARVYELYAKSLYFSYVHSNVEYLKIEDNDWELHANKAIALYMGLQMEWRVIRVWAFLAKIEYERANYRETIKILDKGIDKLIIEDSLETKSIYIELLIGKVWSYAALGDMKAAHELLDTAIEFSRKSLILTDYYVLLNIKTWLLYDGHHYEEAREFVAEATSFINLMQHEYLFIEHELAKVLFEEFFENKFEHAIEMADEYERYLTSESSLNETEKEGLLVFVRDLKARSITRLGRYEEALDLFNSNIIEVNEFMEMSPLDVAIREITKSYKAICYFQLGDILKARELAGYAVGKLRGMAYSSYFQFAREVLAYVSRD